MGKLADELFERSKRDDKMIVGSEIRAALQELQVEKNSLLYDLLHDLYFAGHWTLESGILSKEEQIALWQRVKDITGWSVTKGIGYEGSTEEESRMVMDTVSSKVVEEGQ